jgi:hypothetical protein
MNDIESYDSAKQVSIGRKASTDSPQGKYQLAAKLVAFL